MSASVIPTDLVVSGNISCGTLTVPANTVGNTQIQAPSPASAGIAATKVIHLIERVVATTPGSAVTTQTTLVHLVMGSSCTVTGVSAVCLVAPTSSDTVTVDVKFSASGSTSFATILSGTIGFSSSSVAGTVYSGSLSTTSLTQNGKLEVVITASGSSCQGLLVSIGLNETAN